MRCRRTVHSGPTWSRCSAGRSARLCPGHLVCRTPAPRHPRRQPRGTCLAHPHGARSGSDQTVSEPNPLIHSPFVPMNTSKPKHRGCSFNSKVSQPPLTAAPEPPLPAESLPWLQALELPAAPAILTPFEEQVQPEPESQTVTPVSAAFTTESPRRVIPTPATPPPGRVRGAPAGTAPGAGSTASATA